MPKSKTRTKGRKDHKPGKVWSRSKIIKKHVYQTVFDGMRAAGMVTADGRSTSDPNVIVIPDKELPATSNKRYESEREQLARRAERAGLFLP